MCSAQLMYKGCTSSIDAIEIWKEVAMASNIEPFVLMEFALIYWLDKKKHACLGVELKQFTHLLNGICSIAGEFRMYSFYMPIPYSCNINVIIRRC